MTMNLLDRSLDQITEENLQELIQEGVSERRRIDYKRDLPGAQASDRKEFLYDVSSFANAGGGVIVFGMSEEEGRPTDLVGVEGDPDSIVLRLEQMARSAIEPRLQGVATRAVPLTTGRIAIVMRIPRSWNGPHMVTFQGMQRFYTRASNGKYPMAIEEIRDAVARTERGTDRLRNFRLERLGRIVADDAPAPLRHVPKIVMHLVPLESLGGGVAYEVGALQPSSLAPICEDYASYVRLNFDGILGFNTAADTDGREQIRSYTQVFRSGVIESVDAYILEADPPSALWIPDTHMESGIIGALPRFLALQRDLGVQPPVMLALTLLRVRGYRFLTRRLQSRGRETIDRDDLFLPETIIESYDIEASQVLRPIFDRIWNAAGWPRSFNFDENGTFRGE
jgi:hypothetical protein